MSEQNSGKHTCSTGEEFTWLRVEPIGKNIGGLSARFTDGTPSETAIKEASEFLNALVPDEAMTLPPITGKPADIREKFKQQISELHEMLPAEVVADELNGEESIFMVLPCPCPNDRCGKVAFVIRAPKMYRVHGHPEELLPGCSMRREDIAQLIQQLVRILAGTPEAA